MNREEAAKILHPDTQPQERLKFTYKTWVERFDEACIIGAEALRGPWVKPADRAELERYRATGLTPEDVERLAGGVLPDDDDRAPLPYSDPAMACVEAYEDAWDYPAPEQQKRFSGLLEDDA